MVNIDINIGDEILVGRFKNKRIKVKAIGVDEYGSPTINGKSILKIRVPKLYIKENDNMKSIKERLDNYPNNMIQTIDKISGLSYRNAYYTQKDIETHFKVNLNPLINVGLIKLTKTGLVVFTEKFINFLDLQKQRTQRNHKSISEIKGNEMKNSNVKLEAMARMIKNQLIKEYFVRKGDKLIDAIYTLNVVNDLVGDGLPYMKEDFPDEMKSSAVRKLISTVTKQVKYIEKTYPKTIVDEKIAKLLDAAVYDGNDAYDEDMFKSLIKTWADQIGVLDEVMKLLNKMK